MYEITLATVPNQEFDVFIENVWYHFRLHLFRDMLYADVSVNDELVARSIRCIDRTWMIPFPYTNAGVGNLRFEDDSGQYPDWQRFAKNCRLMFYSNDEIAEMEE